LLGRGEGKPDCEYSGAPRSIGLPGGDRSELAGGSGPSFPVGDGCGRERSAVDWEATYRGCSWFVVESRNMLQPGTGRRDGTGRGGRRPQNQTIKPAPMRCSIPHQGGVVDGVARPGWCWPLWTRIKSCEGTAADCIPPGSQGLWGGRKGEESDALVSKDSAPRFAVLVAPMGLNVDSESRDKGTSYQARDEKKSEPVGSGLSDPRKPRQARRGGFWWGEGSQC